MKLHYHLERDNNHTLATAIKQYHDIVPKEFCKEHKFIYEPDVKLSKWGTPLIPSVFQMGIKHSNDDDDMISAVSLYLHIDL